MKYSTKKSSQMKSFFILTMILSFAFFYCSIYSRAQSDLSEGWEINIMNERQPPGKIMNSIGIRPGMVIGEIGAGRGRFTVYLAREVGVSGKILANDIDEQALTYLEERCKKLGFKNVKTLLGENDDARFPDKSLDKERIEKRAGISGFEIVRAETFLPKDFIFILKVADPKDIK